jgi:hypothetical protein
MNEEKFDDCPRIPGARGELVAGVVGVADRRGRRPVEVHHLRPVAGGFGHARLPPTNPEPRR